MKKHDSDLLDNGIVELKGYFFFFFDSFLIIRKVGDGWKGDPSNAEYDAIHVGAAASSNIY